MRIAQHLRRLRARWRLHRMEWAAMHRPLQPPPGYEHYHTEEANFPGMRTKLQRPKSWSEFKDNCRGAWRIYKRSFTHDLDLTADEEIANDWKWKRREARFRVAVRKGERAVDGGVKAAEESASELADELRKRKPEVERLVKHRISVLRVALHEFSEGYQEAVSGARNFWGDPPYSEDVVRADNKPLLYKVNDDKNNS